MRKSLLFVAACLVASVAAAAPPLRSIVELTPGNAETFRAWAKSAPAAERQVFLDEIKGLERPAKQRVLRTLFPSLNNRQSQSRGAAPPLAGPFAIQYDSFPTASTTILGPLGGYMGNQFDTGLPPGTNTVNTVQFLPAFVLGQVSAQVAVFGPVSGGNAPLLGSANLGPLGTGFVTGVLPTPISGLTGSFQAGFFQQAYQANQGMGFAYLAITGAYGPGSQRPRAVAGPGDSLHLMFVTAGGAHSPLANSTFRNGVFRVSGTSIPVELTHFAVE